MICALTVRHLKPDSFSEFHDAFMTGVDQDGSPPEGWVRFNMLRSTEDPDEVVTFGFFDGTIDELRQSQSGDRRRQQQEAIAPYVDAVGADALYEIVEDFSPARARA